ncbi:hypothetical protein BGZ61DRAFT_473156 [Ilyonectria robusta]|uniref:uncharacterized protein n=1 Tax=Ilyonectria robusta TaxID=1079257 RepID=UPI001E8E78ED|nr:uncharacterized protein BGZ61DRAFT_473156 [Ilyonectria robusta]KAH8734415.1 hypothetical protein BGZ61DRAFT_473156 [Ilyonectria robusta]
MTLTRIINVSAVQNRLPTTQPPCFDNGPMSSGPDIIAAGSAEQSADGSIPSLDALTMLVPLQWHPAKGNSRRGVQGMSPGPHQHLPDIPALGYWQWSSAQNPAVSLPSPAVGLPRFPRSDLRGRGWEQQPVGVTDKQARSGESASGWSGSWADSLLSMPACRTRPGKGVADGANIQYSRLALPAPTPVPRPTDRDLAAGTWRLDLVCTPPPPAPCPPQRMAHIPPPDCLRRNPNLPTRLHSQGSRAPRLLALSLV